jgi:hypothetical protein
MEAPHQPSIYALELGAAGVTRKRQRPHAGEREALTDACSTPAAQRGGRSSAGKPLPGGRGKPGRGKRELLLLAAPESARLSPPPAPDLEPAPGSDCEPVAASGLASPLRGFEVLASSSAQAAQHSHNRLLRVR